MELNKNSTIIDLINSKQSLKKLRVLLSIRDSTIKDVFNNAGYFYEAKIHKWVKKEEGILTDDITFQKALEQLGKSSSNLKPNTNKKLIETNSKVIENAIIEVAASDTTIVNKELIKPNSNEISVELLNGLGMTTARWNLLIEMIDERERMNQTALVDINEIYNEVARLKSRKRKNKTFYISEDLTQEVVEFAEELNVKISQLVEVALIEMLKKYKTNIT